MNKTNNSNQSGVAKWVGAYGRFQSIFVLLLGLIFGIMFIIAGYNETKNIHKEQVNALITKVISSCVKSQNNSTYECDFEVKYTVDNTEYTEQIKVSSTTFYKEGQSIVLYYDKQNPRDAIYLNISPRSSETIFIVIGIIAILGSIAYTVMIWKSRTFATVGGAASLAGLILRR